MICHQTAICEKSTKIAQQLTRLSSKKLREHDQSLMRHTLVNNMLNHLYIRFPLSYLKAASSFDDSIDVRYYLKQLIDSGFATPEQLAKESKALECVEL